MDEEPAKVRVHTKPADGRAAEAPEAVVVEYVRAWSRAVETARRQHRDEPLPLRLRAVALLLAKPTLRAPEALTLLPLEHPTMRLKLTLVTLGAAIDLRKRPVTAHETDEWGEWRERKRDEALVALRTCATVQVDLTHTAEGFFVPPTSEAGLADAVASISGTLLSLLEDKGAVAA